jgi:hypothetical protein
MDKISDSPQAPSDQSPSCADLHFDIPGKHSPSAARYLHYAVQTLYEYDISVPEMDRLTLIVDAALSAQSFFFGAAPHHPGRVELYQFFESFVLSCVTSTQKTEGI